MQDSFPEMQKNRNYPEKICKILLKMKETSDNIALQSITWGGVFAMIWNEKRENAYCEITPALLALKEQWEKKNYIDPRLYKEYNVKRGLRDEDGRGVLTGLTRVAEIQSYQVTSGADGEHIIPADGMLYYRGIDCLELVKGSVNRRFAF